MQYLSSVYFVSQPVHVSGIFVARHQEVYCIYKTIGRSSWNMMAHGDAREGNWRGVGNQYPSYYLGTWYIQHCYRRCAHFGCQQSTELTPPCRFKWTRPFRRKTKSGFCACDITFQTQSNTLPFTAGVNPSVSFIVFIRHATEVFQEAQPWTVRSSLLKEEQFSSNHGTASQ